MATWVVGDVQGCWASLQSLLGELQWNPCRDRLWMVGDLVNRGPHSLDVLRWAADNDDSLDVVLGNHDLHLLARAAGVSRVKRRDTLEQVLAADDADQLLTWLRGRPLAVHRHGVLLVHAGVVPQWTVDDVLALSAEVSSVLTDSERSLEMLRSLGGGFTRLPWSDQLEGMERVVTAAAVLTRIRVCTPDGVMHTRFTGPVKDAPEGTVPWFRAPQRRTGSTPIVFGHWSTLGWYDADNVVALDTGCVWGGPMTAWCLEDGRVVQVPACD